MSIAPVAGATSPQVLQIVGRSKTNAAEQTLRLIEAADRNIGAWVNTPVITGRVDGERGNLVSLVV